MPDPLRPPVAGSPLSRAQPEPTVVGSTLFRWGTKTYIMGIVNVTSDSFSGDGILDPRAAAQRGRALVAAGADLLDVGGVSTRPGGAPIAPHLEAQRVVAVIKRLRLQVEVPISVDTSHASVADAALAAGATIVNDVWGFKRDPALRHVVAEHGAGAVAMHNRSATATASARLGGYFDRVSYLDLLGEIRAELEESIDLLVSAGVPRSRIIVDPGVGFGKTREQNLELLARVDELRDLGQPILVGTSRKSVIGLTLDLPPAERIEGTAATVALAIRHGADMVRVHDLPAMARVARMTDAVVRDG